ncbi:membrane protein [Arthrobacter mangrovi]|uniref:Membrane protein n=1 Tax=Arthrobacter mangrovi TaxID=2966350 RepID=A0ABQ5MZ54_9MICC|nr:membrane protein [Arthrobacter mangrovi]
MRGRLESLVLNHGDEPDPRFTLANERTFLAWIRTSLAFLAAGIAIEAFADELLSAPLRTPVAGGLLSGAALIAALAGIRWLRVERAMRHKAPLPLAPFAPIVAAIGILGTSILLFTLMSQTGT